MNKKEIILKVLSDKESFNIETPEELEAAIDKELSKPDNKIDCDLVDELVLSAIEAKGMKPLKTDVNQKLAELKAMQSKEKRHFRLPKWCTGLAVACVMVMCANVISVSAFDMNVFKLVVEFTKGGAVVDFSQKEEIILPTSESDPYGMIAFCEENGISADTPHYLPEGFILTSTWVDDENAEDYVKIIKFIYENKKQRITVTCREYAIEVPRIGMASDEYNFTEITFPNGAQAVISKEDNQMNFLYNRGQFVLSIFTQDVDYDECEKILQSIK